MRSAVSEAMAGEVWMPVPPCPAHQKNPAASGSKPTTGVRSPANVRRPAQVERIERTSRVVARLMASMPAATSISWGLMSQGGSEASSAGEARI